MRKLMIIVLVAISACNNFVGYDGLVKLNHDQEHLKPLISIEEKQASQFELAHQLLSKAQLINVDFRYAARKVTPGVVHITSTWKPVENQEEIKRYDPFKDFFGDDWFRFLNPFRKGAPCKALHRE